MKKSSEPDTEETIYMVNRLERIFASSSSDTQIGFFAVFATLDDAIEYIKDSGWPIKTDILRLARQIK